MNPKTKRSVRIGAILIGGGLGVAAVFNNCAGYKASPLTLRTSASNVSGTGSVSSGDSTNTTTTTTTGTSANTQATGTSGAMQATGTSGSMQATGTSTATMTNGTSAMATTPPSAKPLTVNPYSFTLEPYAIGTFTLDGGVPPYKVSGDYFGVIAAPTTSTFQPYLPGNSSMLLTDATGTAVEVRVKTTGELGVAVAFTDPIVVNRLTYTNYHYSTDPAEAAQHAGQYIPNGFPIYLGQPPARTHAVYACQSLPGRQFLSTDPACEGRPVLGKLGYLYDDAGSVQYFTLRDLTRIYQPATGLHRVQSSDSKLPEGFVWEGIIGYMPPRVPTAWCDVYLPCVKN